MIVCSTMVVREFFFGIFLKKKIKERVQYGENDEK